VSGSGVAYDAAGDTTNDGATAYTGACPEQSRGNAENRLIAVDGGSTASYLYDAEGHRITKTTAAGWRNYLYGTDGNVVAETSVSGWQTGYVYLGGQLLAIYQNSTSQFVHTDHLGSTRLMTGYPTPSIVECDDYYPYGELMSCGSTTTTTHKFTGKERDTESNLDNFGARYDSSTLGRFMTPDPSNLGVDFWLPQTWNRYSYSLNNPLTFVDRNGLWPTWIHNDIIDQAFSGMSRQDRQALKDASWHMDHDPGKQSAGLSFEHSMRDGTTNQDRMEAKAAADAFVALEEHKAQKAQADWIASGNTGMSPEALLHFGNALHTVLDGTSPAHIGYQPWFGQSEWSPSAWLHALDEAFPLQFMKDAAIRAAEREFRKTFGLDSFAYMRLMQKRQRACVTTIDSRTGTVVQTCE